MDDKNWQLREGDPFASPQALSDEQIKELAIEAGFVFHTEPHLQRIGAAITVSYYPQQFKRLAALLSHTAPQAEPTSEELADMIPLGATLLEPGTMENQPERKVCMTVKQLREFRRAASPASAPAVSEQELRFLPMAARETRVYLANGWGGFDLSGCPSPQLLAHLIVRACNALSRPAQDDAQVVPADRFNDLLKSEHALSASYVRIREMVGAMSPPSLETKALHEYVECKVRELVDDQSKSIAELCRTSPEVETVADGQLWRYYAIRLEVEVKSLESQLSTARADGYAEAIEAAAKVNDESGLQPAISKRIRALQCPTQGEQHG